MTINTLFTQFLRYISLAQFTFVRFIKGQMKRMTHLRNNFLCNPRHLRIIFPCNYIFRNLCVLNSCYLMKVDDVITNNLFPVKIKLKTDTKK